LARRQKPPRRPGSFDGVKRSAAAPRHPEGEEFATITHACSVHGVATAAKSRPRTPGVQLRGARRICNTSSAIRAFPGNHPNDKPDACAIGVTAWRCVRLRAPHLIDVEKIPAGTRGKTSFSFVPKLRFLAVKSCPDD
jgi:hypothetical protein